MRSDKYNKNSDKKSTSSKKRKKNKDTVSEDFLAEFRNMDNYCTGQTSNTYYYNDADDNYNYNYDDDYDYNKKSKKKSKKNKKSNKNNKKNNKNNKPKKRVWPKVVIIIIMLLAIGAAAAFFFINSQVAKFDYVDTSKSDFGIDKDVAKELSDYRTIAILGVDAREGEDPETCRTDAIIFLTINKKTGDMTMTSVMRDTYLLMDSSSGKDILDKATHAHAFGGPVNTCKMLNQSLDLNISEFVVMNWSSVADTVDALGGITVDVQENEIADLNTWGPETAENVGGTWTEITETGEQRIDGVQAATYCRIRKTSGGDPGRTTRIKKVMTAVLSEVKKNPDKITALTDKVFPEIRTNMTTADVISILPQAIGLNIDQNVGFPFNYWGGILGSKWLAIPTTLEDNVTELHEKLFDQTNYNPSNTVKEISEEIIDTTGISIGNDTN